MWEFIDKVYVITLESEKKRQEIVNKNLKLLGLTDKTELFVTKRHLISGQHGVYDSHVAVINLAKKQGHSTVLVLEDDFQFTTDWQTYLPFAQTFIKNTPRDKWDFLLLGILPLRTYTTDNNNNSLPLHITRVGCGVLAHAYIVNETIIKTGIYPQSLLKKDQHIDVRLFCNPLTRSEIFTYSISKYRANRRNSNKYSTYNVFALDPMIVLQRYDGTSNAAHADQILLRLISNQQQMRSLQKIANKIDVYTFIYLSSMILIIIIITLVVVPIVCYRRRRSRSLTLTPTH